MNIIMPTIPNVYLKSSKRLQQSQTQMNNFGGYSFSKQSPGLGSTLSGNTALNNSAVSIINAYFGTLNNNVSTKKNNVIRPGKGTASAASSSFIISKPNFSHMNNKVTIQFFYYTASDARATDSFASAQSSSSSESFQKNFSELSTALAQLFQKEVNIITTRLYYPYLNSDIFSQYLAHNAPSNTFMDFQEAILTNPSLHKTNLPAHVSGIKVQVSGRLVTETVIPRITVKSCLIGSFQANPSNSSQMIDYSKFTTKNELGAFTIKVWICQRS